MSNVEGVRVKPTPNQDPDADPRDVPGMPSVVMEEDGDGNQVVKLPPGFGWDTMSMALASDEATWPTWFAMTGGGTGKILMWSPDGTWDHEDAQVAYLREPTADSIDTLADADEAGDPKGRREAKLALIRDMLTGFQNVKAARRVKFEGRKYLDAGSPLMTPTELEDYLEEMEPSFGRKVEAAVAAYVDQEIPHRLREMIHTAAFILAMPDMSYLRKMGREKKERAEAEAAARGEAPAEPATADVDADPTSGADSSGSTD